MNYLLKIDAYYNTLSAKERIIADYIKENGSDIIYETLSEVSKKLKVGEATIMRFCHKLKYDGFQDLKLEIAKAKSFEDDITTEGGLIHTQSAALITSIQATQSALSLEDLNTAVTYIEQSDKLFLYGIANSSIVAKTMELKLFRMGKVSSSVADSHMQLITSAIVDSNSLIIAFSLTGATAEIYEALKIAKENDAKIIVITNDFKSPVSRFADLKLQTFGVETPLAGGSMEGLFSQMVIADLICSVYENNNKELVRKQREKIADAIVKRNIQ